MIYCPIPTPYNHTWCPDSFPKSLDVIEYIAYFRVTRKLEIASEEEVQLMPYTIDLEWAEKTRQPTDGKVDQRTLQWGSDIYIIYNTHNMLADRKYIWGAKHLFIQRVQPLSSQPAVQLVVDGKKEVSFQNEKSGCIAS